MGTGAAFYKKSRGVGAKEGENRPAVLPGRGGNLPRHSHVLQPALGGWLGAPQRGSGKGGLQAEAAGRVSGGAREPRANTPGPRAPGSTCVWTRWSSPRRWELLQPGLKRRTGLTSLPPSLPWWWDRVEAGDIPPLPNLTPFKEDVNPSLKGFQSLRK